jgi:hypothetical protein
MRQHNEHHAALALSLRVGQLDALLEARLDGVVPPAAMADA